MPGSWEIKDQFSVLCAILHTEHTSIAWSFGLRNLQVPGHVMGLSGLPYDHARNSACMKALEIGVDYLFFLDSDVIPPNDAIFRLARHKQPIVSGVYCRRSAPHGLPVMLRNGQWITDFKPNSLIEADLVGAGCLLIHKSVLQNLPPCRPGKHWFSWQVDLKGTDGMEESMCMSEDFVFCKQVREKLGVKILVDTSIMCRHVGLAQAGLGSMVPCDATPIT